MISIILTTGNWKTSFPERHSQILKMTVYDKISSSVLAFSTDRFEQKIYGLHFFAIGIHYQDFNGHGFKNMNMWYKFELLTLRGCDQRAYVPNTLKIGH